MAGPSKPSADQTTKSTRRQRLRPGLGKRFGPAGRTAAVPPPAALGFRAHSGWAALVALGGPPEAPTVLRRTRPELIEPGVPRQPYHEAEGEELVKAEKIIAHTRDVAMQKAASAVQLLTADLQRQGYQVAVCGVLQASGRNLPGLSQILASHALIHTAEGQLSRDVLATACEGKGFSVLRVREKELFASAAQRLHLPVVEVQSRVAGLGRGMGPPWGQDQKCAALIAWMALDHTCEGTGP